MRTLTLGVLIVSGGTLAALPFRRYQENPDASNEPVQVTGPSESILDVPALVIGNGPPTPSGFAASDLSLDALASEAPTWQGNRFPAGRDKVIRADRRQIDIPLTYEDLAAPLDEPFAMQQRFSATVSSREKQLQRERAAEMVMPSMESLAIDQQRELDRIAQSFDAKTRFDADTRIGTESQGKASASLASTTSREAGEDRLPVADTAARSRHWIRQPE